MNTKLTRALKVFAKTVETGSMSRRLSNYMTASAVSQQITKLEQTLA